MIMPEVVARGIFWKGFSESGERKKICDMIPDISAISMVYIDEEP